VGTCEGPVLPLGAEQFHKLFNQAHAMRLRALLRSSSLNGGLHDSSRLERPTGGMQVATPVPNPSNTGWDTSAFGPRHAAQPALESMGWLR